MSSLEFLNILICINIDDDGFFRGQFNVIKTYVARYTRYSVPSAVLVLFAASSLSQFIVDGPQFARLSSETAHCRSNGWLNLLFIQHYVKPTDTCLNHMWYLEADLLMFYMAPFFVYLLWMFRHRSVKLIVCIILLLQFYSFWKIKGCDKVFSLQCNDNLIFFFRPKPSYVEFYKHVKHRLPQYLCGILTGFAMHSTGTGRFFKRSRVTIGWLLSIGFMTTHVFYQFSPSHSILGKKFYISVSRELWTA